MTLTEFNSYAPAELLNALVGNEGELNIRDEILANVLAEAEQYVDTVYPQLPMPQRKRLIALEALFHLFLRQGQYDYVTRVAQLKELELTIARTQNSQSTQAISDPQIFTKEVRESW